MGRKIILIISSITLFTSLTILSYFYWLTQQKLKYYEAANNYRNRGKFTEAIHSYKKLLNHNLDNENKAIIHTNIGYLYYKLNQLDETQKNFEKAIQYAPKAHYYHNLAILFYEQDKLNEAEKFGRKAQEIKFNNELAKDLELIKLEKELSKELIQLRKGNYIIKYQKNIDKVFAYYILKIIEEVDKEITPIFNFFIPGKVIIKIFDEVNFNKLLRVIHKEGVRALCINNKLIIAKPLFFSYNKGMEEVVAHEYIHLILHRICGKNLPVFLDEGIAQFFSKEIISDVKLDKFISLNELKWNDSEELSLSYKASLSFVNYLIEHYGFDKFAKLIFYFYVDKEADAAFQLAYNKKFEALEEEWRKTVINF